MMVETVRATIGSEATDRLRNLLGPLVDDVGVIKQGNPLGGRDRLNTLEFLVRTSVLIDPDALDSAEHAIALGLGAIKDELYSVLEIGKKKWWETDIMPHVCVDDRVPEGVIIVCPHIYAMLLCRGDAAVSELVGSWV